LGGRKQERNQGQSNTDVGGEDQELGMSSYHMSSSKGFRYAVEEFEISQAW
jgi:hypothetical protein